MRKPDITYTDILPRDVELYVGMDDEEYHKLESIIYPDGEQRFDIKVWSKEEY